MGLRSAVFIDRDGTLTLEREYLSDPASVRIAPGAIDALSHLKEAGFALMIVTNQSGIACGYYTLEDYQAVAARVDEVLEDAGVPVDMTLYCPHHPDITGSCPCRKPRTGMYLEAAQELDLDPSRSFYVGDKLKDVLPALELGGQGVLVRTGYGRQFETSAPDSVVVVDDLDAAGKVILGETWR